MPMNTSQLQKLKIDADAADCPIAYVSAPTPSTERIVFADSYVAITEREARDHIARVRTDSRS